MRMGRAVYSVSSSETMLLLVLIAPRRVVFTILVHFILLCMSLYKVRVLPLADIIVNAAVSFCVPIFAVAGGRRVPPAHTLASGRGRCTSLVPTHPSSCLEGRGTKRMSIVSVAVFLCVLSCMYAAPAFFSRVFVDVLRGCRFD